MLLKNLIFRGLFLLLLGSIISCDVINPEEEIPSYLHVSAFTIQDNSEVEEISRSAKIVAANILVNNISVGVLPLPGTIPIYDEGSVEVQIDPLVQENGSADFLQIYPFWERTNYSIDLTRGDSTILNPATKYLTTSIINGSDFAGSNIFFTEDLDGNSNTKVSISQTGGQTNEGSIGKIILDEDNDSFEAASSENIAFEIEDFDRAWLEVQYKSDVQLVFGLRDLGTPEKVIFREYGINPKDEWNTLYFDLAPLLLAQSITRFQLTLTADFPQNSDLIEAEILLDNIKLVYL